MFRQIMTSKGILLNNALSNFASSTDESTKTANLATSSLRPLSPVSVAIAVDEAKVCGQRIVAAAATPDALTQVHTTPPLRIQ